MLIDIKHEHERWMDRESLPQVHVSETLKMLLVTFVHLERAFLLPFFIALSTSRSEIIFKSWKRFVISVYISQSIPRERIRVQQVEPKHHRDAQDVAAHDVKEKSNKRQQRRRRSGYRIA